MKATLGPNRVATAFNWHILGRLEESSWASIGIEKILLIGIALLIFFGPSKLPELGKALGKGIQEFRRPPGIFRSRQRPGNRGRQERVKCAKWNGASRRVAWRSRGSSGIMEECQKEPSTSAIRISRSKRSGSLPPSTSTAPSPRWTPCGISYISRGPGPLRRRHRATAPWFIGALTRMCGRGPAKARFLAATIGGMTRSELETAAQLYAEPGCRPWSGPK